MRQTASDAEGVQTGEEGAYRWERRVAAVPVPREQTPPGAAAAMGPQLRSITVSVRWGQGRSLQLATMRASLGESTLPRTP
jgi:hypothetical protein